MSSFALRGRMLPLEPASPSGRSAEVVRLGNWRSYGPRPSGVVPLRSTRSAQAVVTEPARPPAGPSTVLCSSLSKERKKLAKVLKSHRKVLEKRLSALQATDVNAPVLSELLTEIRTLRTHLESQRAAALLFAADSSDSSDSDDECTARSLHSLACARGTRDAAASQPVSSSVPSSSTVIEAPPSSSSRTGKVASSDSTMVISGLNGQMEVAVPEPQEGWAWDEEAFRAAQFLGTGGRIMVCTGSKCQRKGATEVLRAVSALSDGNPAIEVIPCKCVGKCSAGAALRVRPAGQPCATYTHVRPGELPAVFQEHFGAAAPRPAQPSHSEPAGRPAVAGAAGGQQVACALDTPTGVAPGVHCCVECTRDAEVA